MSLIASRHGQLFRVEERLGLHLSELAASAINLISSCFEISRPHQHGIASKQAQVPKKNTSTMLVGMAVKMNSSI